MSKQARIIREIEQSIALGRYREGEKLPTQKELMNRFGVALGTVQSALEQLQARGVLTSTRGRGTIVNAREALKQAGLIRPRVELLMLRDDTPLTIDPSLSHMAQVLQQALDQHGFDLVPRYRLPQERRELLAWAGELQAAVVLGVLPARVAEALRIQQRPTVIAGELFDEACPPGTSQVTVALELLPQLLLAHLAVLGHRRIALVRGEGSFYLDGVGAAFDRSIRERSDGLTGEQWLISLPSIGQEVLDRWRVTPPAQRPTALMIEGGQKAGRVILTLQRAGIQIPEDLSICAINGQPKETLAVPDLTRADSTLERMGAKLGDVLLEVLRDHHVLRQVLAPDLIGGTTCRLITI